MNICKVSHNSNNGPKVPRTLGRFLENFPKKSEKGGHQGVRNRKLRRYSKVVFRQIVSPRSGGGSNDLAKSPRTTRIRVVRGLLKIAHFVDLTWS